MPRMMSLKTRTASAAAPGRRPGRRPSTTPTTSESTTTSSETTSVTAKPWHEERQRRRAIWLEHVSAPHREAALEQAQREQDARSR